MPVISRIRFTNVVYDNGAKRYIDTIFKMDGENTILLLENGAGKTVFVQTLIQAVLPHKNVAGRKIQETLNLQNNAAHIAVEWIIAQEPRRYALTAVTLYKDAKDKLASQEFATEYGGAEDFNIEKLPFVKKEGQGTRPASREEIADYYRQFRAANKMRTKFFSDKESLDSYGKFIEENWGIVPSEWSKIADINSSEGGVDAFFASCRTVSDLVNRLLIPTVEEGIAANEGHGEEGNGFVSLFERQREHIREQVRLEKRIKEMQGTTEELEKYNKKQKSLYEAQQELLKEIRQLKAFDNLAEGRREKTEAKKNNLDIETKTLADNIDYVKQEIEAVKVRKAEDELKSSEQQNEQAKQQKDRAEGELKTITQEIDNLEYARLKQRQNESGQKLAKAQEKIAALDESPEEQELRKKLRENHRHLAFVFNKLAEKIAAEAKIIAQKQAENAEQKQKEDSAQKDCSAKLEQALTTKAGLESRNKILLETMERLEHDLFPDLLGSTPEAWLKKWEQEQREKESEVKEYEQNILDYQHEGEKAKERLESAKKEASELSREEQHLFGELTKIDSQGLTVKKRLELIPGLMNLVKETADIYDQYDYMIGTISGEIAKYKGRQQELEAASREAHRYLDIYREAADFSADPLVYDWIDGAQGEFTYLEAGSDYYRRLENDGHDAKELLARFPFWSSAVIVTENEKNRLKSRLEAMKDKLFEPVFILGEQEAREIIGGREIELFAITPKRYENISHKDFVAWRENLAGEAEKADKRSEENRLLLGEMEQTAKVLRDFLTEYPATMYQELRHDYQNAQSRLARLRQDMAGEEKTIETCTANIEKYRQNKNQAEKLLITLENNISQGKIYLAKQQEQRQVVGEISRARQEGEKLREERGEIQARLARIDEKEKEYISQAAEIKEKNNSLRDKPYYKEAQEAAGEPLATEYEYEILAETERSIRSRLEGFDENRNKLEAEAKAAAEIIELTKKDIDKLYQRVGRENLDENYPYPSDGEERSKRLAEEQKARAADFRRAENQADEAKQKFISAKAVYEKTLADYKENYAELLAFEGDPQELGEGFRLELNDLLKRQQQVKKQLAQTEKEVKNLEEFLRYLQREGNRFEMFRNEITPEVLDISWQEAAIPAMEKELKQILERASAANDKVQLRESDDTKARMALRRYAEENIREDKMRRSIVTGIETKRDYEEFSRWHEELFRRIGQIIRVAEDEKENHRSHIRQMIEHMEIYISNVIAGLRELISRTRINVDDRKIDVFSLHLPDFKNIDLAGQIEKYIGELSNRLDTEDFRDEFGRENQQKVRAELKKSLSTPKLLGTAIGGGQIRVSCRKAISGGRFSASSYSWEESNRWSGGEMWSKNMALFLGCLDYLSEKRFHQSRSKFNTRVVVADNPFGKASNDHVLEPVFFIARRLGFQFIALTAHEEGNFIRRYFPVVYSCHFVPTADKQGKVIEANSELDMAYFEEHNPDGIERMNEYEQQGLF